MLAIETSKDKGRGVPHGTVSKTIPKLGSFIAAFRRKSKLVCFSPMRLESWYGDYRGKSK